MKKILFLFFIVPFIKVNAQEAGLVKFSAHIDNPNSDSLYISVRYPKKILKVFRLDKNGNTSGTLEVKAGYYQIGDGTEVTQCYLKPGFDLHLYLDTRQFDETIKYTGKGACENNYLAAKFLKIESFGGKYYYPYWAKLEEKECLHLKDSIYSEFKTLFNKFNEDCGFDKDFAFWEWNELKYSYLSDLANYEGMHHFLTGDNDFSVSDSFPNPFEGFNPNDDKLAGKVDSYDYFLNQYISYLTEKKFDSIIAKDSTAIKEMCYYCLMADVVDSVLINKTSRNAMFDELIGHLISDREPEKLYARLSKIKIDSQRVAKLDSIYNLVKRMSKGTVAPDFRFYDIDSNVVTLSSLKGNLVYIDIWATWCSPCIKEVIPMQELIKEYQGKKIKFVSICRHDSYERWKKFVTVNELKGIQLYAPNADDEFFKHFLVDGIPRYILIDAEGKVIDHDAPRPSWGKPTKELIDKYLPR